MIGKSISNNFNLTNDLSKVFEDRTQLIKKQDELKEKIELYKEELEELRMSLNTVVSIDDLNILVQDIKQSFELFVNNTPRDNKNEELEIRLKTLEEKLNKIEIIQTSCDNENITTNKKAIPKLNLEKKKR